MVVTLLLTGTWAKIWFPLFIDARVAIVFCWACVKRFWTTTFVFAIEDEMMLIGGLFVLGITTKLGEFWTPAGTSCTLPFGFSVIFFFPCDVCTNAGGLIWVIGRMDCWRKLLICEFVCAKMWCTTALAGIIICDVWSCFCCGWGAERISYWVGVEIGAFIDCTALIDGCLIKNS